MKVVVDTNVFISALFYSGIPRKLFLAWTQGVFTGVLSSEIVAEYRRIAFDFIKSGRDAEVEQAIALVLANSVYVEAPSLPEPVCSDPDDDVFVSAAIEAGADVIVSGDKHLLELPMDLPFRVLKPIGFMDLIGEDAT